MQNNRSASLVHATDNSIVGYQAAPNSTFYYRKWRDASTPHIFEKYAYNQSSIYLVRDTSWGWTDPASGVKYNSYDTDGTRFTLVPRYWSSGYPLDFYVGSPLYPFNSGGGACSYSSARPVHGWHRWVEYRPQYNWGGNIGVADTLVVYAAYNTDVLRDKPSEVHYYARDWGWVAMDDFNREPTTGLVLALNRPRWTTTSGTRYTVNDACPPTH
jgi:hypothetical protein